MLAGQRVLTTQASLGWFQTRITTDLMPGQEKPTSSKSKLPYPQSTMACRRQRYRGTVPTYDVVGGMWWCYVATKEDDEEVRQWMMDGWWMYGARTYSTVGQTRIQTMAWLAPLWRYREAIYQHSTNMYGKNIIYHTSFGKVTTTTYAIALGWSYSVHNNSRVISNHQLSDLNFNFSISKASGLAHG